MSDKFNQMLEAAILGKLVECLLDAGMRVTVSDQDGGGLHVYGVADNGEMAPEGGYEFWVKCVPGNGADFISDYAVKTEPHIKGALDLADLWRD